LALLLASPSLFVFKEQLITGLAVTLILAAAVVHATWNFLAKRAGGGAFVWLFAFLTTLIYCPLAVGVLIFQQPYLGAWQLLFMLGSAVLHLGYFLLLQWGYDSGDLSLVYPLARGSGPTLSTLAAIAFFGERPPWLALLGAAMVIVGVFVLSGGGQLFRRTHRQRSIAFGILTGLFIAGYTLWDKHAVSVLLVPPLLLDYGSSLGRVLFLAPYAYRQRDNIWVQWRRHRWEAIGVACLNPLSYILVLTVLTFTPVSYVAPAREVSVLLVVGLGVGWLKEGDTTRRLVAAGLIAAGVMMLALN
jgi:drug/metabolite transporter (DMT)-like permease